MAGAYSGEEVVEKGVQMHQGGTNMVRWRIAWPGYDVGEGIRKKTFSWTLGGKKLLKPFWAICAYLWP